MIGRGDRGRLTRRELLQLAAAGGAATALVTCVPGAPERSAAVAPRFPTERLVVIQNSDIPGLDPQLTVSDVAANALRRINEGLVERAPDTMQPMPGLATSWRATDDLTWEFKLRTGVKFTNGEPFDASVAKFSLDRILDPANKAALGLSLGPILDRWEAVDPATFRIRTKTPYPLLLERIIGLRMVPPALIKEKGNDAFGSAPVGTGPYRFKEWIRGSQVTITRNDDHWGPKPAFTDVVFRQIAESSTALAELLAGTGHVVTNIIPDQVETVKASKVADLYSAPAVTEIEVRMDALARGGPNPFTNKNVRLAANYAIDKDAIAKSLLGGYSKVVATNIVPQMFGYDASVQPYPYDPARAKQLLAQSGYPDGFSARFIYFPVTGFRDPKSISEAIAGDLGKVGIRCELQGLSASETPNFTNTGKAGPIFLGGNPNGGGFDGSFGFFYLRKRYTLSYYYTDELESLMARVDASVDPEERKRLLSQIQKTLHDDAPYVWGWSGFNLDGVNKGLDYKAYPDGDIRVHLIKPKS